MSNLTGGAAILARMRAQKDAKAAATAATTLTAPAPTPAAAAASTNGSAAANGASASAEVPPSTPAVAAVPATQQEAPPAEPSKTPVEPAAAGPAPMTGSAAILAKLRAQKAAASPAAAKPAAAEKEVVFLYASQTGTAQEVAKTLAADAKSRGFPSQALSFNELGFDNCTADKTPLIVFVASSTGDGDPPDNAAKFYVTIRKRSNAPDRLKGVQYTSLGLGDSNYTRFMHVPRVLRQRFDELGAAEFYKSAEADEVDGIEGTIDKWSAGLWAALKAAMAGAAEDNVSTAAAATATANAPAVAPVSSRQPAHGPFKYCAAETAIESPAPLPQCRVKVTEVEDATAAASILAAEALGPSAEQLAYRDPAGAYSLEQPFYAPLKEARVLTSDASSDRRVIHVAFDVTSSGFKYAPGDAIAVGVENDPAMVEALLKRLGWSGDQVVRAEAEDHATSTAPILPHIPFPCSLRRALSKGCDIAGPVRKTLLRLLAEHCSDAEEKATLLFLSSRGGRDAFREQIEGAQATLLDLLLRFPSCSPPLGPLLDALPPLMPRYYSLTCGPVQSPETLEVALSVVRETTPYGPKLGVASNFLDRSAFLDPSRPLKYALFLKPASAFRPPEDLSVPWILIGPGTGVAPFRSFLQDRQARLAAAPASLKPGPCVLYFGCRRREEDFIYEADWEAFARDRTLSGFHVAFSRQNPSKKVYVQHLMADHGERISEWILEERAYVFVCGDGVAMAKDVNAALSGILEKHGGLSAQEAAACLTDMSKAGRYVRDIWG